MHSRIFGIGETVLDLIFKNGQPQAAKAGGSVLNALISLARCGHEVWFISEVGNDQTGNLIMNFLDANHINTKYIRRFNDGQTPLAMAMLNENNDARYQFYKNYPADRHLLTPDDFCKTDILLFGSFYSINPDIREQVYSIAQKAKSKGACIVYDPNFRKQHQQDDQIVKAVEQNMRLADWVRASNEDIFNLFGIEKAEDCPAAVKHYCNNVVITANKEGVWLSTDHFAKYYTVPAIKPVSTIGAGDNFNAGIVHTLASSDERTLNPSMCDEIIANGIAFSSNVCLSLDNYVDEDFAQMVKSKAGKT